MQQQNTTQHRTPLRNTQTTLHNTIQQICAHVALTTTAQLQFRKPVADMKKLYVPKRGEQMMPIPLYPPISKGWYQKTHQP
jgi:hypothetical protein